jgi:sulfotransferase
MNKKFYFLCSLPRSGNTLLGSLLNQNKNIAFTAKSILPYVLEHNFNILELEEFKNFPDIKSFNNIYKNIFNLYYKDWDANVIIDRGQWGTRQNIFLLNHLIKDIKFIILHRPLLECLASFIKIKNPVNKEFAVDYYMNENQIFGNNLESIKNIINNKHNHIIVKYDDLIKQPETELEKIYKFVDLPYFKHDLKNFNQFKVNNVSYNDYFLDAFYHTIRTDKIEKQKYKIEDILPNSMIKKYSNLDII